MLKNFGYFPLKDWKFPDFIPNFTCYILEAWSKRQGITRNEMENLADFIKECTDWPHLAIYKERFISYLENTSKKAWIPTLLRSYSEYELYIKKLESPEFDR